MAYIHKHTKGDWKADFSGMGIKVIYSKLMMVCKLIKPNKFSNTNYKNEMEQYNANHKLIEQAPKLLQIAEMYLDQLESEGKGSIMISDMIRQTIIDSGVEIG